MELYGKKVVLRSIEEKDLEDLRKSTNDPEFEKTILGWAYPISKEEEKIWYDNVKNDRNTINYIIETKEEGAVGLISINDINWKNGSVCGKGIRVYSFAKFKGIATDAWMALLNYVFNELRLNRVFCSVIEYNKVSLHVCEKVGFKIEGISRQAVYKNGKYWDVYQLGCLKSDYEEIVKNTAYWN